MAKMIQAAGQDALFDMVDDRAPAVKRTPVKRAEKPRTELLIKPPSFWQPPTSLPRLSGLTIGLDTETCDLGLGRGRGPGWVYRDGYMCGVSVAWGDEAIYASMRHPDTECMNPSTVIEWVEYLLRNNRVAFFNISYDMGWLQSEGCTVWPERSDDGGTMAFLIDENYKTWSLDDCCKRAGLEGKNQVLLDEALNAYGVRPKDGTLKHGIHLLPARYVGPYAEDDARQTLRLCERLRPTLIAEETMDAYETEMALYPITNDMRRRGIRISETAAEEAQHQIRAMRAEALKAITVPWRGACTIEDLRSPARLVTLFDAAGVPYPRTNPTKGHPIGQPSFTAKWLNELTDPLGKKIRRARLLENVAEKFIGNYIVGYAHRGRIHSSIRQLAAVTHRFSYADPPLQQMPSRVDEELANLCRNIFEPEVGEWWLAADFKSQEPRLTVHYAWLARKSAERLGIGMSGIEAAVRYYREDPNPDPHQLTSVLLTRPRYVAKQLNLGLTYRLGAAGLALQMNIPEAEAAELWALYHSKQEYVSGLSKFAEHRAKTIGFVKMIDGARRHYPLWQPARDREKGAYLRREQAEAMWPNQRLERAFAYQAGNSVIQGSAARQTKKAMVLLWRAGHRPSIQMHDEIGSSVNSAAQCREIGEIMASAVKLVIPVTVDLEVGRTWGQAKTHYEKVLT